MRLQNEGALYMCVSNPMRLCETQMAIDASDYSGLQRTLSRDAAGYFGFSGFSFSRVLYYPPGVKRKKRVLKAVDQIRGVKKTHH